MYVLFGFWFLLCVWFLFSIFPFYFAMSIRKIHASFSSVSYLIFIHFYL